MAAVEPVRTPIERYCKSRHIRTESRQVAEASLRDQQRLWKLGIQMVFGILEKCTLGLWHWTIGRFGTRLNAYSGSWALAEIGGNCASIPVWDELYLWEAYSTLKSKM